MENEAILNREDDVLHYIVTYCLRTNGVPPTLREISNHCQLNSTSVASHYIDRLVRRGLLRRVGRSKGARCISVVGAMWLPPEQCQLCNERFDA